jgi:WD40 repeat protein
MAGNIFISYRRSDDPGFAQALYLRLEQEFPGDSLFMDVEGQIKPGDDFEAVLNAQVAQCDVLLAIIGERWIDAVDEEGHRRLEKEDDFVRIEIASALGLGKRVIPVLVNQAQMPRANDLPQSLKPLARRNAVAIRPTRFKADSQGLINALKEALALAETERATKSQAEREAAEAERKRREADEEARAAQVEAAARQQAMAGLTPAEIRKAEELANWDFIKESARPEEFRDHLARFAGGTTDRYARRKLEALLWADPASAASIDALRKFLDEFPAGEHAAEAKTALDARETAAEAARQAEEKKRAETEAWARVAASADIAEVQAFLQDWPDGAHAADAKARIRELRGSRFTRRGVMKGFGTGAAVGAAGGGILYYSYYSATEPGGFIWRQIHDESLRTFTGHNDWVRSVAFSPDGARALSAGWDRTLKLWDIASGRELQSFMSLTDKEFVLAVQLTTGTTGRALAREVHGFERETGGFDGVAFSPDGAHAISTRWGDNTLQLWELASGHEPQPFTGHTGEVSSVAFSPDGARALSGSDDRTLKLWEVASGRELHTFTGHAGAVHSVAFSPDGARALSGSSDRTLKLWDLANGRVLRTFTGHADLVRSVAFFPDGARALSGSDDKTLKLWHLASGSELRTFTGHSGGVTSVAFSLNGVHALSGGSDRTLKLWDVASGRELHTFTGHTDTVWAVVFSPDGVHALSASDDDTLKLWDLSLWLAAR